MKKNKLVQKLLVLLPMIFILTGCDSESFKHWTGLHYVKEAGEVITKLGLDIAYTINDMYSTVIKIIFAAAGDQNSLARYFLNNYAPGISNIVNVVSFIAIAFVIVNFAKSVYQNNMSRTDNVNAPSAIQLVKKLFVAVLATFIVPYVVISAFGLTTYAGDALFTAVQSTNENVAEANKTGTTDNIWNVYDEMRKDKVDYCTVCEIGQRQLGQTNLGDLYGTDQGKNSNDKSHIYGVLYESDGELYNKWCNYNPGSTEKKYSYNSDTKAYSSGGNAIEKFENHAPANIYESLRYSKNYYRTVIFTGFQLPVEVTDADGSGFVNTIQNASEALSPILGLLDLIATLVVLFIILIMIIKRVVELVVLIMSSWYYIGASICDQEGKSSLSDLWKKLLKLCLTQFLITFEFFLYVDVCLSQGGSLLHVLETIVWILILTGTPTAIDSMIETTGTAEGAAGAAKSGIRAAASFFGGRN